MTGGLVAAAVVPAAPLLLPAVSPRQPAAVAGAVAALRDAVRTTLAALPDAGATVLLAAGPRGVHGEARASMAPLGVPSVEASLPVARDAVEHVTRLTQYPMLVGDPLGLTHSVLLLLLREARGAVPIVPVSVPAAGRGEALVAVGASLAAALEDAGVTATLVCPGDLSSALAPDSPGHAVEGARAWDEAVVAACRAGELGRLVELGREEAQRVGAQGWAPLVVLHGACAAADLHPVDVRYHAPRGVGQLVARFVPPDRGPRRAGTRSRARGEGAGGA